GGRRGDSAGDVVRAVPVLCALADVCRHQALRAREDGMTLSRRDFLKTSGALVVYWASEGSALAQGPFDTRNSHVDPRQLDSWIAVAADGTVTARTGKCELGQGIYTAQLQLIAEELSVPIARVKLIQCDTDVCPDQGTTSGSQSTPTNFNER